MLRKLLKSFAGDVSWRRMPWPLPLLALALTLIGAAFIWSSHSEALALKHCIFALIGIVVFALAAIFDYRRLSGVTFLLYLLGILTLAGLWSPLGVTRNYARRWYDVGFFLVQPSEPMKLLLALALADYFRSQRRWQRLRDLVYPITITGAGMFLIVIEPDFGTALMLAPVFFGVAFLGGVRMRNLVLLVVLGVALLCAAWFTPGVMRPYQKARLISFINPEANPESSAAYNAEQAMLAVCAGGVKGQGWGRGVLNRLGRVPERHTDFIFPVIAEEWGLVRTGGMMLLQTFLIFYLGLLTLRNREPFGRLVAGGVLSLFGFQTFLHIAIGLGFAPITGLTLPLASYGGSSLLTTYAGFGLVASTRMHRDIVFSDATTG
ncbi:MAG: FtsW/RodA/SpoVE family cell cycle protein [Planctomycetes bacterium]|nr:FtsW/RodA/SpoVE family cell cycle protein [Planctomycetota bacterium]